MRKWLISIVFLSYMLLCMCGCNSEQAAEVVAKIAEAIPDPNTIAAVGDTVGAVGAATGRPELVGLGIVLGGLALIVRKLIKGKK